MKFVNCKKIEKISKTNHTCKIRIHSIDDLIWVDIWKDFVWKNNTLFKLWSIGCTRGPFRNRNRSWSQQSSRCRACYLTCTNCSCLNLYTTSMSVYQSAGEIHKIVLIIWKNIYQPGTQAKIAEPIDANAKDCALETQRSSYIIWKRW